MVAARAGQLFDKAFHAEPSTITWMSSTAEIYPHAVAALGSTTEQYSLASLRYDLSKLRCKQGYRASSGVAGQDGRSQSVTLLLAGSVRRMTWSRTYCLMKPIAIVTADNRVGQVHVFDLGLQLGAVLFHDLAAEDDGDLVWLTDGAVGVEEPLPQFVEGGPPMKDQVVAEFARPPCGPARGPCGDVGSARRTTDAGNRPCQDNRMAAERGGE